MAHQKITYVLILLLFGIIFSSCKKKLSKEDTTVEWLVINPVTGAPYEGVPVKLYLEYYGNSSGIEGEMIYEGITNSSGRVSHTFKAYEHNHYGYWGKIDWGTFGTHGVDYAILKQPENSVYTVKKNHHNELRYEIVPYAQYFVHTKNIDCQGGEDRMRLRRRFIYTSVPSVFSNWMPNEELNGFSYLEGCYENFSGPHKLPSDSILYEIEVTKNGITQTFFETFYIGPEQVDTIKIYY